MIKTSLSAMALTALMAIPVRASDHSPVSVEVLQGWELADGRRVVAIKLSLEDGWKTYWRAPGDSGIPPLFSWKGARNIAQMQITWPQPKVFDDGGVRSIGYKKQLVIPLHIAPKRDDKPVHLKGRMDIGICSDICAPYTLKFDTKLEDVGSFPTPEIASALASAPFSASEAGVKSATCRLTPTDDGMQIEARVTVPSTGGREETVIEAGQDTIWVSEPVTTRKGDQLVAVSQIFHSSGAAFSVNRSAVRITILGSNHAIDIRGCSAG
ncbi:protein-disulfide reductase DsbD family protein [Ascidiaceihabitans sp.]|nr:protein-disulfide reductase DsbD family protein [Ascidiaceihabitans sp.]